MNKRLLTQISLFLIVLTTLSIIISLLPASTYAQQPGPGPASNSITIRKVDLDKVAAEFSAGRLDAYLYAIRPTQLKQFEDLVKAGVITFVQAPAGLVDFIFNPAPVKEIALDGDQRGKYLPALIGYPQEVITQVYYDPDTNKTYVDICCDGKNINPLALREVRFALNYAIDRDYVVKTIYMGYAAAMYTYLSPYDPTYMYIADVVAKYQFKYDLSYASSLIESALTKVGAYKVGGKWYYAGSPITLTFIIRPEDERKEIGDMFANALDALGFTVNRQYLTFGEALSRVYDSNPTDFLWHIYTEGWGKGALERYDSVSVNQFCAPWFGYMPGWQTEGWWWYRNDAIDEMGMKLYFGQYKSKAEWEDLLRSSTDLCIQDGIRAWVATRFDLYPVSTKLMGITYDLGSGLRSIFNYREMYISGKPDLSLGHLWVYTTRTIWNVYGGFTDIYSYDPSFATRDPATWRNPFNGMPIPFRFNYTVETAGPTGTLKVPSDAFIWDAKAGKWVNVAPGTTAISKVTFDLSSFIGAKWHDGTPITWGDVLANLALWFDLVYNSTKASRESAIAGPNKPYFDTLKGFRIDEAGKKLEVYVDFWHFDPNYIADYAAIIPFNPAELLYIQNVLVFDLQKYAFSSSSAIQFKVPQLNLVLKDHAASIRDVATTLTTFPANLFTLPNGKVYMTSDEWSSRLKALISWIDAHGSAWISQGPFYLDSFDRDNQVLVLKAFRDPTYPFSPGRWYFGKPTPTQIIKIDTTDLVIGQPFVVNVTLTGVPPLIVRYIVTEIQTGTIITSGEAENVTPYLFTFSLSPDLTTRLRPYYLYQIQILGFSDSVALPDFTSISKEAIPASAQQAAQAMQQALQQLANSTNQRIEELSKTTSEQIASVRQELETRLGQVAETLSKALGDVSTSLSSSLNSLSATMSRSITDLSNTLNATNQLFSTQISSLDRKIDSVRSDLSSAISSTRDDVSRLSSELSSLSTIVYAVLGLSIVNLVLGIVLIIRRK